MYRDPEFHGRLRQGSRITPRSPVFRDWPPLHTKFDVRCDSVIVAHLQIE